MLGDGERRAGRQMTMISYSRLLPPARPRPGATASRRVICRSLFRYRAARREASAAHHRPRRGKQASSARLFFAGLCVRERERAREREGATHRAGTNRGKPHGRRLAADTPS